jgi:hypothetical protein
MAEPPTSATPSEESSRRRERITIALSLIGAGASLNSWFPAFQLLGAILIVAGLLVLAGAAWPVAKSFFQRHLHTRARMLFSGFAVIALASGLALAGLRPWDDQLRMPLNVMPAVATTPQRSLLDFLPDERELPVPLVEQETNKRTGEALARLRSSGADELMQRLLEWTFVENAYRNFGRAKSVTPTPDTVYLLEVSVLQFENSTGASAALDWFAEDRSMLAGLPPKPVELIGDESQAIAGSQEGTDGAGSYREATVYARSGPNIVRVTARSRQANPMSVSIAVAKLVIARMRM